MNERNYKLYVRLRSWMLRLLAIAVAITLGVIFYKLDPVGWKVIAKLFWSKEFLITIASLTTLYITMGAILYWRESKKPEPPRCPTCGQILPIENKTEQKNEEDENDTYSVFSD